MTRVPARIYRVVEAQDDRWIVSEFDNYQLMAPEVSYSWESLPDWIKADIAMLKMAIPADAKAGRRVEVNGLGTRLANVFWLNDHEYARYG